MSETVKLIIEIPKGVKQEFDKTESIALKGAYFDLDGIIGKAIQNGIPLDNIDSDETRAYFDVQAYGWEEGRKALIDDVKAEIEALPNANPSYWHSGDMVEREEVLEILNNIGKGVSE